MSDVSFPLCEVHYQDCRYQWPGEASEEMSKENKRQISNKHKNIFYLSFRESSFFYRLRSGLVRNNLRWYGAGNHCIYYRYLWITQNFIFRFQFSDLTFESVNEQCGILDKELESSVTLGALSYVLHFHFFTEVIVRGCNYSLLAKNLVLRFKIGQIWF